MMIIFFLTEFHYMKKSCKFSTFSLSPQYYATSGTACRVVSIMFHSLFHYLRGGSVSRGNIAQQAKGMKIGTLNVRSLYRAESLKAAVMELVRYKLDVVGVQEVRWDKGGTVRAGDYDFFLWERK